MKHSNISIFIPHIGCKCRCSFCNQIHITGYQKMPDESDITKAVEIAVNSKNYCAENTQLAFFGGSFTAIDRELMIKFLKIGHKFIEQGKIESIRISTRPDAINPNILNTLKRFGVKSIELGAQSMDDEVLKANNRGHSAQDVINACNLIKENGFELGLQMMTGLYKSDFAKDLYTAEKFVELNPDTVRIYPTVVLKNTLLEEKYFSGEYKPFNVENACKEGAKLLKLFYDNNISVIRFGLHSIEKDSFVAGAFHPALSEIAQSYIYRDIIEKNISEKGFYEIFVNSKELSKIIGNKRANLEYFKTKGIFLDINTDNKLNKYEIKIKEKDGEIICV